MNAAQEFFLRCFFYCPNLTRTADSENDLYEIDPLTLFKTKIGVLPILLTRSGSTIRKNWLRVVFKI